jgi:hypothetical protein
MRFLGCILLLYCTAAAAQGEWVPPSPPDMDNTGETGPGNDEQCRKVERVSHPVASYRISPRCRITDVQAVGDYTYGIRQLKAEIDAFQTSTITRRFVHDAYQYRRRYRIELHKALEERPAILFCETDMMETRVYSAYIQRTKILDNGKLLEYQEPVELEDGRLPDLGIYTHSSSVTYTTDQCL